MSVLVSSISKYLESSTMSDSDIGLSQQSLHHFHQQANHSVIHLLAQHLEMLTGYFSFCCSFSSHHASLFPTIPCLFLARTGFLFQSAHTPGRHVHCCYVFSKTHNFTCLHIIVLLSNLCYITLFIEQLLMYT